MSLADRYAEVVRNTARDPNLASERALAHLLRRLAKWRSTVIANTIVVKNGTIVQSGPFKGMDYIGYATEGCLAPRLLGSYESELHPVIEEFAHANLDVIIDIGCAEGYYAVGMAMISPGVTIHARDIDERARKACQELAAKNGVSDRIVIGGEFTPDDFEAYRGQKVLVLVDAEGAEDDLLDPARSPALSGMNLLVETHNMYRPGVTQRLIARFSSTHTIQVIDHEPKIMARPDWLKQLGHLDQLLAIWEWRSGPTPWLIMRPKA